MAPPKFADLGKSTRGLFADDYVLGEKKLTLKSTASNGVNFKVEGARNSATGNVTAFLETKFSHSTGVTIKEKWNTSNNVTTEITLDKLPVAGTKAIVETVFSPNSGFGSATLKGEFAQDKFNTDFAVGKSGSVFNGVLSYQKVLLGGSVKLDKAQKPSELKAGLSFVEKDLTVSTFVTNGEVVEGSVYHVPTPNLETAVRFSWTKGQKETTFEVGSKYSFDKTTFLKAKVDLALNFGFSYTQSIYKGVSLNLSALIKGDKLNADGHQLGLGLTLEN